MSHGTLCIATHNPHKLAEIRAVLAGLDLDVRAAADDPTCTEVDEDQPTLAGNAEKKARWVAAFTGLVSLADDTGLEVDALDGAPGVYSARYAGPGCTYADNNRRLLAELGSLPAARRTARFRCVIAIATPPPDAASRDFAGRVAACHVSLHDGCLEGQILDAPRGTNGFGYDPVFWIPAVQRTLAELTAAEKNTLSHRARALAAARECLRRQFAIGPG